jgi:hypothetical protein
MKRIYGCLFMVVVAGFLPADSQAQFLKNLVNNVTQNISNKAAGKATGTTGKHDSASMTGKSGPDSAMIAQFLAGANKPNSHDSGGFCGRQNLYDCYRRQRDVVSIPGRL